MSLATPETPAVTVEERELVGLCFCSSPSRALKLVSIKVNFPFFLTPFSFFIFGCLHCSLLWPSLCLAPQEPLQCGLHLLHLRAPVGGVPGWLRAGRRGGCWSAGLAWARSGTANFRCLCTKKLYTCLLPCWDCFLIEKVNSLRVNTVVINLFLELCMGKPGVPEDSAHVYTCS